MSVDHSDARVTTGTGVLIKRIAATAAVALVANLLVWLVAMQLGVDFRMGGAAATTIGLVAITVSTLVAFAVGGGITLLVARRSARGVAVMAWVGLALAVVSLVAPLTADATAGTRWSLALMHLISGAAWWATLRGAGRR